MRFSRLHDAVPGERWLTPVRWARLMGLGWYLGSCCHFSAGTISGIAVILTPLRSSTILRSLLTPRKTPRRNGTHRCDPVVPAVLAVTVMAASAGHWPTHGHTADG